MKNRKIESLTGSLTHSPENPSSDGVQIFISPSDIGVRRNLGRNGARLGPQAALAALAKLNNHNQELKIEIFPVTTQAEEKKDFEQAQQISADKLLKLLEKNSQSPKFHLGGGHDHAYPLLVSLQNKPEVKKILILNIDAHCDTRIDDIHHSGTPFRNFDEVCTKPTKLIQYGVHHFSNGTSTLSDLKKIKQDLWFYNDIAMATENFSIIPASLKIEIESFIDNHTAILLSLDCDALPGYEFPAVSAPNPQGIPLAHVKGLADYLQDIANTQKNLFCFGIYEYNPVFDQTSALGAKTLATLIYNSI